MRAAISGKSLQLCGHQESVSNPKAGGEVLILRPVNNKRPRFKDQDPFEALLIRWGIYISHPIVGLYYPAITFIGENIDRSRDKYKLARWHKRINKQRAQLVKKEDTGQLITVQTINGKQTRTVSPRTPNFSTTVRMGEVTRAVSDLTQDQKAVIVLRYVKMCSQDYAAHCLRITVDQHKKRMRLAKQELRHVLFGGAFNREAKT